MIAMLLFGLDSNLISKVLFLLVKPYLQLPMFILVYYTHP